MEENIIQLEYGKLITNLTGNRLGRKEFRKKIEPNLDFSKKNIIVFPDQIDDVGISFFQGLCQELFDCFGKKDIESKVMVKSKHEEIERKFIKTITI